MKAVILVGGEGTRLRPLTATVPKPMIPVVNRPFLEHVLDYLKNQGVNDVILSMGYRSDVIERYFGDGTDFGITLTYVVEDTPLGTAGGVKNVERYLDDTFFVFNGDIMTDLDLKAMVAAHHAHHAKVSIALTTVEDPTAYGLVEMDSDNRVNRFIEKPRWDDVTTNMINAGTYVIEPDVFKYVPPNVFYMLERGLFPVLLQTEDPIYGYPSNSYWIDIGTPKKYLAVHHDILTNRICRPEPGERIREGVWVGRDCTIDPTARISGPVVLGNRVEIGPGASIVGPVAIGDGCSIGRETVIEDAVIWAETRIGAKAMLKTCVVGSGTIIEDQTWLTNGAIVADRCVIGGGNRLEQAIKIWPGRRIEPNTISF